MTLKEREKLAKFDEAIERACESYSRTIKRALSIAPSELKNKVLKKEPNIRTVVAKARDIAQKQNVDAKIAAMESYDFLLDLDPTDKKSLIRLREIVENT